MLMIAIIQSNKKHHSLQILKMINQLSEINLTLNQINENISELRIETKDNLQKINYNLQINNLYSLIGLFQNKRMNKTLTNINNSSN